MLSIPKPYIPLPFFLSPVLPKSKSEVPKDIVQILAERLVHNETGRQLTPLEPR